MINYFPLEYGGGGEYSAVTILNNLSHRYDITYYSSTNFVGYVRLKEEDVKSMISFKYIRTGFVHPGWNVFNRFFRPMPPLDLICDFDAVVIFVDRPISGKILKQLSRSTKVLFLLHGLTIETFSSRSIRKDIIALYTRVIGALFTMSLKKACKENISLQVFNQVQKTLLLNSGIPDQQIFDIPMGVDFKNYSVGTNRDKFIVTYLGRLESLTKGSLFLPKVARKLMKADSSIELHVVGSGGQLQKLRKLTSKIPNVKMLGYLDEGNKIEELKQSSLLIVTSNIEPFSVAILEGLASGLPAVALRASGPSSIISSSETFGTISNYDASEFVRKILLYKHQWDVDKNEFIEEKSNRAALAKELFDLPIFIDGYAKMFESILGSN